jgi:hypothetical protein
VIVARADVRWGGDDAEAARSVFTDEVRVDGGDRFRESGWACSRGSASLVICRRALEPGNLVIAEIEARTVGNLDVHEALELTALVALKAIASAAGGTPSDVLRNG